MQQKEYFPLKDRYLLYDFKGRKYIGETMLINGLMMFLVTPYLSIGTTYLISVKLHLPAFWNGMAQTAFLLICLTSVLVLFFANTAGVFILSGMQKACPKTMIGRLMAVFNTLNNLTFPIGIWMHGILYEKCEKHLPCLFGVIAALTIGIAVLGKRVYAQFQKAEDVYL